MDWSVRLSDIAGLPVEQHQMTELKEVPLLRVCVTCLVRQACHMFNATPTRMIPNALMKGRHKIKKEKNSKKCNRLT